MDNASLALFKKEWRGLIWFTAIAILVLVAVMIIIPATFYYLKRLATEAGGLALLPPEMRAQLGFQLDNPGFYVLSNWLKNTYQILTIIILLLGPRLMTREFEIGTFGFLLSRPVTRGKAIGAKFLFGIFSITLFTVVGLAVVLAASAFAGIPVELSLFLGALPAVLAGAYALFGISVLISTLFNEQIKAGVVAALVFVLLSIPSWIRSIKGLSIFHHMSGASALIGGGAPWGAVAVLSVLTVATYYFSCQVMERKDF